jgi:toxin HigB-1
MITLDVTTLARYPVEVIKGFKDDDTESIFRGEPLRRFGKEIQRSARRRLTMLHAAESLQDLRVPPGNRLEKLKGDREGQHSSRVSDQWRICFVWREHAAYEVEIVDYH